MLGHLGMIPVYHIYSPLNPFTSPIKYEKKRNHSPPYIQQSTDVRTCQDRSHGRLGV